MTTLVVTNDFPPRIGGIESFVADICGFLDADVVVLTSATAGGQAADRTLPYEVVRTSSPVLLPGPTGTLAARRLLRRSGASRVVFGAAAPLALMAPALRRAGAERIVALTHGHESWWSTVPAARGLLRRIGDEVDALTTISDYVAARIRPALSAAAGERLIRLPPPVDVERFRPAPERPATPRCVSVARFVPRKGVLRLLRAWRTVLARWPRDRRLPELILVGDGPQRRQLERAIRRWGLGATIRLTGALDRWGVLATLQGAQVFALPVRTRWAGLDPEGLGLAALEAAACGLPVVVGRSGGAPETVREGISGYVVDDVDALADRLGQLLLDPDRCTTLGLAGRQHVQGRFAAERARRVLRTALELP